MRLLARLEYEPESYASWHVNFRQSPQHCETSRMNFTRCASVVNARRLPLRPQSRDQLRIPLGGELLFIEARATSLVMIVIVSSCGALLFARGRLVERDRGLGLESVEVIWRQVPKVSGRGHYGHRIVFGPAGHLWVSSGDRQKFSPAQDMRGNLGKIVRLDDAGGSPGDNPFADRGGVAGAVLLSLFDEGHVGPTRRELLHLLGDLLGTVADDDGTKRRADRMAKKLGQPVPDLYLVELLKRSRSQTTHL